MNDIRDLLCEYSARSGRPGPEIVREYVLEGLLRRLAGVAQRRAFVVLRGGMLTRLWTRPAQRPAQDLDFVGLCRPNADEVARLFRPVLEAEAPDGVLFSAKSLRAVNIWQDTTFPGVRLMLRGGLERADQQLSIDIGFNDPLIPAQQWIEYPLLRGDAASVWAVRPETAVAWKLHGLSETGERRWRPKDLYDIVLVGEAQPLEPSDLHDAIEAAFTSRGDPLSASEAVFSADSWWHAKSAQVRWEEFRQQGRGLSIPAELSSVVERARRVIQPNHARSVAQ